jgi:hypothetical protein
MAYELPFNDWLSLIKDKEAKTVLGNVKLPDDTFFGESVYKIGNKIINISAKTTDVNVTYLSNLLKTKAVGKNLDIVFPKSKIRFIVSGKKNATNRNALGKKLSDAGELATIVALTKPIKSPEDTRQQIFKDDVKAFKDWQLTFELTPKAVNKIIAPLPISQYTILHDATDRTNFKDLITAFTTRAKVVKDSWNPADIYLIKTLKATVILTQLLNIVKNYEGSDLVSAFNAKMYDLYKKKDLIPISLKQLTGEPKTELNNIPGANIPKDSDIVIKNLNCDMSLTSKEIGLFTFTNKDTNKTISMQVRGFPHGYTIAQTEITSDGSLTGGRLGKVPTSVVDRVLEGRINSISFFGNVTQGAFNQFDQTKINEVWTWYITVINDSNVTVNNRLTKKEFEDLIASAKNDFKVAETLCIKIQGLKIMYLLLLRKAEISVIMNKLINGAKKISSDNGFFIKIY